MSLRLHQTENKEVCREILDGQPINTVINSVTPGGGKSLLPVIYCQDLIPKFADRLCWVVPRNTLKYQGEGEFLNTFYPTKHRIRVADNIGDLSRGYSGYATTYQAIGQNPKIHLEEFKRHRYMFFLDEPHHISEDSSWSKAVKPLIGLSKLNIYASGTFSRNDGKKIAFQNYDGLYVDLENSFNTRTIIYNRSTAIQEGAIVPIRFTTIDGVAEWKESEEATLTERANISNKQHAARAVFAALKTEYAFQLLIACIQSWEDEKKRMPNAKLLVVAPDIKTAKKYHHFLFQRGFYSRIATSEDPTTARNNIDDYKASKFNVLVTVAMAYEGLSVPTITHIACLTIIRSIPWLEQCFARANRTAFLKTHGHVFAPHDRRFLKAIAMIENDQFIPIDLKAREEKKEVPAFISGGESIPWIHPVGSQANADIDENYHNQELTNISPSDQEKTLKREIRRIRQFLSDSKKRGATKSALRVFDFRVRNTVDKKIDEMTVSELSLVWMKLRKIYLNT